MLESRELLSTLGRPDAQVHAAAKRQPALPLQLVVSPGDSSADVVISGKTTPKRRVRLDVGADGSIEQTVKSDRRGRFQFTFAADFGATQVKVIAGAGKRAPTGRLTVKRADSRPPLISIRTPTAGQTLGGAVMVAGRVTDSGTGVATLQARLDGGSMFAVAVDAAGNFNFPAGVTTDGPHTVSLFATDRAGNATGPVSVSFTLTTAAAATIDQFVAADGLQLKGVSADSFNATTTPLVFELSTGSFYPGLDQVTLAVNGKEVSGSQLTLEGTRVTASGVLADGLNTIAFSAFDFDGHPLYLNTTVAAGSNSLTVNLQDEGGQLLAQAVTVQASLGDNQAFALQAQTSSGQVVFNNVPDRTILVRASAAGNLQGLVGVTGSQGTVNLTLAGFKAPSAIDNNDLSQGTAGWVVGPSPVQVAAHEEGIPGQGFNVNSFFATGAAAAAATDNDLVLSTAGQGEQSISRTFTTKAGTTSVKVRYRFITSEVPGGYFGSKFNDYFRVSIRSQQGGGAVQESNSMNGLGLSAFDYNSGATSWREQTLAVTKAGDTVQVDVAVANVADGLYGSKVVVDFIEEQSCNVKPSLAWNPGQGGLNLSYEVVDKPLDKDMTIKLYWANGTSYANRLGDSFYTLTVPSGTAVGSHAATQVLGNFLKDAPAATTHLIAVCDEQNAASLADVQIGFGSQANQGAVSDATIDVLKDLLRMAGRSQLSINSTARTPEDQARAMFNNLVHSGDSAQQIQQRVNAQLALYAPPGDAVVNVFAAQAAGQTADQILANRTAIEAAMVQEINSQGPSNVSKHCADTSVLNVVDVGIGVGQLFFSAAQGDSRVSNILNEPNNGCYHLEIPQ